jgi:hypothetical protein
MHPALHTQGVPFSIPIQARLMPQVPAVMTISCVSTAVAPDTCTALQVWHLENQWLDPFKAVNVIKEKSCSTGPDNQAQRCYTCTQLNGRLRKFEY